MTLKAPSVRNKRLYYCRAKWSGSIKRTLESLLIEAHEKYKTVGERTFIKSEGEIRCASDNVDKGIYLHIACYKPGEATSTIDKDKNANQSTISTQNPPDGQDYLVGDLFAYIKSNHVVYCATSSREPILKYYLQKILGRMGHMEIEQTLKLLKVANADKVKMIKQEGVKEIKLNVSLYEASIVKIDKHTSKSTMFFAGLAKELKAILSTDPDTPEITESENLNVGFSLTFDGKEAQKNKKKINFGEHGKERLINTAELLLNEFDPENEVENDFEIVTCQDNHIKASEIKISTVVRINKYGNSINKIDAWTKLRTYYNGLKETGSLET